MNKKCWLFLILFAFVSSLSAKEYYFRLDSGAIFFIVTDDDVSLIDALISGDFESSFSNGHQESISGTDSSGEDDLRPNIIALPTDSSEVQTSHSNNAIELVNICYQPVIGEEFLPFKCAMPTCTRRFQYCASNSRSLKSKHQISHFKSEFLESLNGQLVVCLYCGAKIKGILAMIIRHFSRYCPGPREK